MRISAPASMNRAPIRQVGVLSVFTSDLDAVAQREARRVVPQLEARIRPGRVAKQPTAEAVRVGRGRGAGAARVGLGECAVAARA